ncbi:MAG: hypothetical protein ACHREM_13950 [Polyangiales bacterium]
MELDAFTTRLGVGQGRIVAGDGSLLLVLGDVEPGRFAELAVGDHVDVVQSVDLTGVALIRANLSLRVPASVLNTLAWEASIVVDGAVQARLRGAPGRTRRTSDLAANVSKLAGLHDVGVRLALVAA